MFPQIPLIGFVSISNFWLFVIIGLLISLRLILKNIQRQRLSIEIFSQHLILMTISGIFFSRVFRAVFTWQDYTDKGKSLWELLYLADKEYSIWGALIGIFIIFIPYAIKKEQDIFKWLDVFTVPLLIGLSIGNIGLFLDGTRHFGTPTNLPWGAIIETSKYSVPIHPVAIYSAIFTIGIAYFIQKIKKNKLESFWCESGNTFLLATASFCLIRFFEEFIVGNDKYLNLFGIYITYYITLILLAAAITLLIMRYNDFNHKK